MVIDFLDMVPPIARFVVHIPDDFPAASVKKGLDKELRFISRSEHNNGGGRVHCA
jgi:hypothetical protein